MRPVLCSAHVAAIYYVHAEKGLRSMLCSHVKDDFRASRTFQSAFIKFNLRSLFKTKDGKCNIYTLIISPTE